MKLFEFTDTSVDELYFEELEHQRITDLVARQRPGFIFYPLAWALISTVIFLGAPAEETTYQAFIFWLVVIVVASVFRCITTSLADKYLLKGGANRSAKICLGVGLLVSAGSWGVVTALSVLDTPLQDYMMMILMSNFALCAGGGISLSISRPMVVIFLLGMLFPLTFVNLFFDSVLDPGFGVLVVFYMLGMYGVSLASKREYELMVVSNIKLQERTQRLKELSALDGLTGIKNRAYFNKAIVTEINHASRMNYPITLLMIDIDHFKHINDTYGHLFGDECLVKVVDIIRQHIHRSTDIIARFGGEEFAIILPGIEKNMAQKYAEQLRSSMQSTKIRRVDKSIAITISIGGVTLIPNKGMASDKLISLADTALYQSKHAGRNCITWAKECAQRQPSIST